jgi:hypothetical protein
MPTSLARAPLAARPRKSTPNRPQAAEGLPAGGFVAIPPSHPHYAWAGEQETIVQVHGVGPTDLTFLNPAADPRKKR